MYRQVWAKYKYAQVMDTLVQFLNTKQEHGENLTYYAKRFKQSRDNVKSILGEDFLSNFIETTDKYAKTMDTARMTRMKKDAFKKWTAYMMLRNSNNNKYGLLKATLNSQYALGNN